MASRYRWRQQLLGSLQGQLQLATYLVVFLGFTGASSVGLLIGQRNLLANDQQLARQSIALCDKAIRGLQDDPARLEQELLFHSNANTSLWIEDNSGTLVLLPLLWTLWTQRRLLWPLPALLLAIFTTVMVVVNSWITAMGMGVEFGWLDHLLLALSEVALTVFFLTAPDPEPVAEP